MPPILAYACLKGLVLYRWHAPWCYAALLTAARTSSGGRTNALCWDGTRWWYYELMAYGGDQAFAELPWTKLHPSAVAALTVADIDKVCE